MIIEWLWVRGRESSLFSAPRFRLWGTAPGRSPRIRDAYTVGKKLARCQRCRARIPTYPYISLHISTIWPEYDQNMTSIDYMIIWYSMLLSTLLYYCSDRPVNQPSNQQKSAMTKPAVRRCRDAKPRMVLWHHEIPWPVEHNLLFHAFSCYFYVLTWQQYSKLIRFRPRRTEVNTLEVDPSTTAACFVDRLKKWSDKVKVNKDQGDTQLRLCEHHVKAWTNNILGPAALCLQSHSIPWYPSSSFLMVSLKVFCVRRVL